MWTYLDGVMITPWSMLKTPANLLAVLDISSLRGAMITPWSCAWQAARATVEPAAALASAGFAMSVALTLICTPVVLISALRIVWSLAAIGPARKTLSTALVLLLCWAPPLLASIALAIAWSCFFVLSTACAVVLPSVRGSPYSRSPTSSRIAASR